MNNYTNPVTVTGNPASFEASGNGKLLSLSVPFSPIQDLHGYSSPWPAGGGKNKLKYPYASGSSVSANNVTYTVNSNGSITIATNGTASAQTDFYFCGTASTYESIGLPSGTYTFSVKSSASITTGTLQVFLFEDGISLMGQNISGTSWSASATISDTASYRFFLRVASGKSVNTMIEPQAEAGSTPTEWTPYSNICPISGRTGLSVFVGPTTAQADATTYAVDWTTEAGTVYGGSLDVVTGVLTVDRAQISSYAGETLPGAWISDRDAYAAGTTPTTGAQVVYELATPITYQLTPTQVELLIGQNNVWSDSNEAVTLTYVIELFTRYTFIVNGNDYTGLVERDSYRTAVTPVYGETIQTLDGVGHTALLRVKGSLTVKLNPQTAAQTAAICADLLNAPCEVQYKCLQRNVNVTALMVLDAVSAMFMSRCLYLGQKWNDVDEIVLKEL